jgi:hypothetical protein
VYKKNNKELLDKVFLEIESDGKNESDTNLQYPNSHLDLSKDNDSY